MATEPGTSRKSTLVPMQTVDRDTVPKMFFGAIERFGRPDALRYKAAGRWQDLSHAEVAEQTAALAAALVAAGVGAGDRVAILSENRPEWAIADFATLCIGAADVPVYSTLPSNQVAYILENSGARVLFVSTIEQLEKVLEIRDQVPNVEQIICFDDPAGAAGVERFQDVLAAGRRAAGENGLAELRERAMQVGRDDLATLIYTSGTTGDPKGVMLSHYNLASNVAGTDQHGVMDLKPGDVAISFLPLSHSFERMVDYFYWDTGVTIAYAESIDKLADNLIEISPNAAAAAPRIFEKIYTRVMGATGIKRTLVMWAKKVGEESVDEKLRGVQRSPGLQARLADKLVFSKLRAKTGGAMRAFVSGSAPLSADIARFFWAAGLPVYEGYGLSETSPVLTVNRPGETRLGTVGQPLPGVEIRISEEGEILARGPNIMQGYWNNPEATAEVIGEDGWLRTGDIGVLDEGDFLRITDRMKNLIVTAGGKNIAPQPIESVVAMSPYVAQTVMIGDRRPFASLIVVPDFENVAVWAKQQGISATREQLAKDPRVKELLEKETLGRLDEFARYEQPKKIAIVPEEFTIESGMLTPTLKIKRRVVEERYRADIEELYAEKAIPV